MARVSGGSDQTRESDTDSLQFLTSVLAAGALFTSYVSAVTPLIVEGASFVNSVDGARFQVVGIA
jgi:hypothetical protein